MTKRDVSNELAARTAHRAECEQWLLACPFDRGDPFFETAGSVYDIENPRIIELARQLEDAALLESIEAALNEGEYGDFDESPAFWNYISNWAFGKVLR